VNESAVLLVGSLAWPVTILIIVVLLLITQRESVSGLINRITGLKTPVAELVAEKGVAVISTAVESLSRDVTVQPEPDKRPADTQMIEPIQNREPIGEIEQLPTDEVANLVVLRAQAANLLEELAYPPPPGGFGAVSSTLEVLHRRGVLDQEQTTALRQLIEIADEATRGAVVPRRVAQAVRNSGLAILIQLDKLRTVAGPKFEEHVLVTLRQRLPPGWSLDIDRAIPREAPREALTDPAAPADTSVPVHARVDALVTAGDRSAVVEIRARLQPGQDGQIEAVRGLLAALPPRLPVLLVMLGERVTDRELQWICSGHEGPVELLLWDREASELVMMLRGLLEQSGVTAPLPRQRRAD
jgi:hypothetical protein